jgi:hypothetical protein
VSRFNDLLNRKAEPVLYAFDLLWLNGVDYLRVRLDRGSTTKYCFDRYLGIFIHGVIVSLRRFYDLRKTTSPQTVRDRHPLLLLGFAVVTLSGGTDKGGESCQDDPGLTNLVKQLHALRPEWPYAVEAVTLLVRLEQETPTRRVADVRIIYTLFALRDLTDADFVEVAHSHEPVGRVAIFHQVRSPKSPFNPTSGTFSSAQNGASGGPL